MRNEKLGIRNIRKTTVLLFSLLFALCYLILACNNFVDTPDINEPAENGYGKISVSITEEEPQTERTVLPSTADFTRYVYTFTKSGEGIGVVKTPNSDGYFILEIGNYTVDVKAYIGNIEPYTLAASGESSLFSVGPGSNPPIEVRLSCFTAGGQGKFKYTITYPAGAAVVITMQRWPGMGDVTLSPVDVSLGNGKTQTMDLGIGSYLLTVVVRKNGLYAGNNEAVHIYPSIITEYTKAFNDNDLLVEIPPTVNTTGTVLFASYWADGTVSATGEQWFTFEATADTQYIHANFDTLTSLSVQVYSSSGSTVGSQTNLNSSTKYISRPVTSGQVYYIKVTPSSNSGTYQIAFNTSSTPPLPNTSKNAIALTANLWADGNIASSGGEQWFKFTATASQQYIHVSFGTLTSVYIQLFDQNDIMVGDNTNLNSTKYISRTVTNGYEYRIRVTPYSSSYSGTYKIAFNTTNIPPGSVPLTADTWADGNVSAAGEQWFRFTANANSQYIHVSFGTLNDINVQLYNSNGNTVGDISSLSNTSINKYISQTVTSGQIYYIKITPFEPIYSGTYRIGFNTTIIPPGTTTLTVNTWSDINVIVSGGDEQWFKFTATAATQYIHASFIIETSLSVQLCSSSGSMVGDQTNLTGSTTYTPRTVTRGQVYYIKVTLNESYSIGIYKIGFNTTIIPPGTALLTLTADTWADGAVLANGEQWFTFEATAATQYIHVSFDTLTSLSVQVYSSNGSTVGSQANLDSGTKYISRTVTIEQVYYIKVTPSSDSGTYQIAFNTSSTPPLPNNSKDATALTANTWSDGNIADSSGEQWFKFTATAATQYIHVSFDTLTSLSVQMYSSSGSTVGSQTNLSGSTRYTSRTVTIGQAYYIKVMPSSSSYSGTYRISFNLSSSPPSS